MLRSSSLPILSSYVHRRSTPAPQRVPIGFLQVAYVTKTRRTSCIYCSRLPKGCASHICTGRPRLPFKENTNLYICNHIQGSRRKTKTHVVSSESAVVGAQFFVPASFRVTCRSWRATSSTGPDFTVVSGDQTNCFESIAYHLRLLPPIHPTTF